MTLQLVAMCANPVICTVNLSGQISAIGISTFTAGGRVVSVDSHTILRQGMTLLTLDDLKVGALVTVSGQTQPDGSVQGLIVEITDPIPQEVTVLVQGAVSAVGTDAVFIVVGAASVKRVEIDTNTTFSGAGNPASVADLAVGDSISVVATLRADGRLVATSIIRF